MPLTSTVEMFYLKQFLGMNNKVEENELPPTHAIKARNCRFEEEVGSVSKREPLAYYNSTSLGNKSITGLYRYYNSDGSTIKLICAYDTFLKVGTDSSGTFTNIKTGLTTGKRCSFVTYKNLVYKSNGYDNIQVYDGSSDNVTWEMGACKAVLASGGTNLDSAAAYYYAVTMDTDTYICGAVSNTVTTDASNRKVTLSNIPLGPIGTANRKIYRTEGGGSTLKLLTTISDNTTTTYADDVVDGSLGATMGAVTDDAPKGRFLKMYRERLFIAGDPSYPNRIYYSNVYLPHYIQQTVGLDYMDVSPDDGDEISGIPIQLGVMVCIKKNNIRKLHITTPVSGADPATWYADDPIIFDGCPAPWSITQTPFGIAYLGWDHWYMFNGASSIPIIDEFDTNEILPSMVSEVVAHYNKGILYGSYTDLETGTTYNNRVMQWNFKRNSLSYDDMNVDSFASFSGDDETGSVYYGGSNEGYVYLSSRSVQMYRYTSKSELTAIPVNLLTNTSMETWTAGASSAPDDWTLSGTDATVARESTIIQDFTYSAKVTRVGTDCMLKQSLNNYTDYQSKTVIAGAWVYATVASRAYITIDDGVGTTVSSAHSGGSGWEWITTAAHSVSASASELTVQLNVKTGNTAVYFDNVVLLQNDEINGFRDDIEIAGEENEPIVKIGDPRTVNSWGSTTVNNTTGTVDMPDTTGIIVFSAVQITAGTLDKIYWNQVLYNSSDTVKVYTRTGATQSACNSAAWSAALTNSNGSVIASTANIWMQVKVELTANSTSGTPYLYFVDGYVLKYTYYVGGTVAETSVNFLYEIGFRNFDAPFVDKIFKKIVSVHKGEQGTVTISWETEHTNESFTFDLANYPQRWESFFPSTAYGRKLNIKIEKNDLYDFKLREIMGLYTPEPLIM